MGDNIKMYFKELRCVWTGFIRFRIRSSGEIFMISVMVFRVPHGGDKYLERLNDYQLLKDSVPWS
jgi:hypothetical protein